MIEQVECEVRFLPPYRPDLKPIELAFSKLKRLLSEGRAIAEGVVANFWELAGSVLADEMSEVLPASIPNTNRYNEIEMGMITVTSPFAPEQPGLPE